MEGRATLAQTLPRNRLFQEISRDKLRLLTVARHKQKTPEKPRFSRLFRGLMRKAKKWALQDLNL